MFYNQTSAANAASNNLKLWYKTASTWIIIGIPNKDTYYEKMVDLISVFYIHKLIQSELLGKFQYSQGQKLLQRFKRHDWYKKEENLIKFMDELSILIEYLN